ncbi:MAG: phytochelatin synthase family protein [Myxococcales bacterium]
MTASEKQEKVTGRSGAASGGSFYRRPLPEGLIAFSSEEGRRLFREALAAGHMEGWFALSEQFHTQADPAFCGLGTLVVVLNALEIDPGRIWKGPWRWYGEDLLDCCLPLERVHEKGITLDELACLARCNGATTTTVRAGHGGHLQDGDGDGSDPEALRVAVRTATAAPRGPVLVAGYARSVLGQTGGGHFSPIAGYHPGRDLVLILDVARFKYPPHWVPLPLLWQAMAGTDPATGRARGWIVVQRGRQRAMPVYFRLAAAEGLTELAGSLLEETPALLATVSAANPKELVTAWVNAMTGAWGHRIRQALRPMSMPAELPPEHRQVVDTLLAELHATAVYQHVRAATKQGVAPQPGAATAVPPTVPPSEGAAIPDDLLAMLLLSLPNEALSSLPRDHATALSTLRDPARLGPTLVEEITALRDQLTTLRQWCCR